MLSGGPCAFCDGVTSVADFADVDEMNADGPARKGRRAAVGLAARITKSVASGKTRGSGKHVPRSAEEAADLVVESMTTKRKEEQKGNSRLLGYLRCEL